MTRTPLHGPVHWGNERVLDLHCFYESHRLASGDDIANADVDLTKPHSVGPLDRFQGVMSVGFLASDSGAARPAFPSARRSGTTVLCVVAAYGSDGRRHVGPAIDVMRGSKTTHRYRCPTLTIRVHNQRDHIKGSHGPPDHINRRVRGEHGERRGLVRGHSGNDPTCRRFDWMRARSLSFPAGIHRAPTCGPCRLHRGGLSSRRPRKDHSRICSVRQHGDGPLSDYNDMGPAGHPSDAIPGRASVAEIAQASGAEILRAIFIMYEVGTAMSRNGASPSQLRSHGVDTRSHRSLQLSGAGVLLRLTPTQLGHAISLAIVPHVPLQVTRTGRMSHWKCGAVLPPP